MIPLKTINFNETNLHNYIDYFIFSFQFTNNEQKNTKNAPAKILSVL